MRPSRPSRARSTPALRTRCASSAPLEPKRVAKGGRHETTRDMAGVRHGCVPGAAGCSDDDVETVREAIHLLNTAVGVAIQDINRINSIVQEQGTADLQEAAEIHAEEVLDQVAVEEADAIVQPLFRTRRFRTRRFRTK